nr:MAG TPA: holin [Caudoviricetes sp.]
MPCRLDAIKCQGCFCTFFGIQISGICVGILTSHFLANFSKLIGQILILHRKEIYIIMKITFNDATELIIQSASTRPDGSLLIKTISDTEENLKTIVFLAVVDYITGVIKGIYTKKLSSETGFKGLLKKIVMFIVIAVSFSIQELIGNTIPLREVVIMFYICNEALSLLENAAVFVPIPDKLKDVLIQLRDKDTEEDIEGE